ncbi:tetratricopeptide repeat protein [Lewinella cohaerens]|uniref:tetratricopeptide repeat protein n=1 Tax=Lewinella cohaerens TaxID=70995 RepID=UPI0003680D55|nr:tetratricopeptide repeat protein [Lewinella cohaerens]
MKSKRDELLAVLFSELEGWTIEGDDQLSPSQAIESRFDVLFKDEHEIKEMLELLSEHNDTRSTTLKNIVSQSIIIANGTVEIGDKKTIVIQASPQQQQLPKYRTLRKPPLVNYLLKRRGLLATINDRLQADPILLLYGRSGIGKSVLAENYFHEYSNSYQYLMWVPYEADLPTSYIRHRDSSTISLAEVLAEAKQFGLKPQEINRRCAEYINRAWSNLSGTKLLVIDGLAQAEDLVPFLDLLHLADCHILITAVKEENCPIPGFAVPALRKDEIETMAKVLSETALWDKSDLAFIAQNTLLLDLVLRHCPTQNPQWAANYLRELHSICEQDAWEDQLLHWLMEKAPLSAAHRWILVQWATLPENTPIELDTFCRIIGMEDRKMEESPDFAAFKYEADGGCYRTETNVFEDIEPYHTSLSENGWIREDEDAGFQLHPLIRRYLIETYGIKCAYISQQSQLLEANFFIREEVGYDEPDDELTQKCQLVYEEHLTQLMNSAQAVNTGDYRSLVVKYIAVLKGNYDMPLLGIWLDKQLKLWEEEYGPHSSEASYKRNDLGSYYLDTAQFDSALLLFLLNLEVFKQIGERQGEGATLNNISLIHKARGDYDMALEYLEQSLTIAQEIGDRQGEGAILDNIGQIYHAKGGYDTALHYLNQSLDIRQEIGNRQGEGTTLNNISQIYHAKGDYDTALHYLDQSLDILQQIGNRKGGGMALNNISLIYHAKGDDDTALRYLQQSLDIQQQIGDQHGFANSISNIGAIYFKQDKIEEAFPLLIQGYLIFQKLGSPDIREPASFLSKLQKRMGKEKFDKKVQEVISKMG